VPAIVTCRTKPLAWRRLCGYVTLRRLR
jgi:hypothetical protein